MERTNETAAFMKTLGRYRGMLHRQSILTLRGQALSGDVEGAKRGLDRLLRGGERAPVRVVNSR